jgi:hypothetical protein
LDVVRVHDGRVVEPCSSSSSKTSYILHQKTLDPKSLNPSLHSIRNGAVMQEKQVACFVYGERKAIAK